MLKRTVFLLSGICIFASYPIQYPVSGISSSLFQVEHVAQVTKMYHVQSYYLQAMDL